MTERCNGLRANQFLEVGDDMEQEGIQRHILWRERTNRGTSGKTIYTHGAITYVFSHVSKSFVELSHRLQENNETTILSQ